MKLDVECYSGYKSDERPISFTLAGRKFMIEDVLDRWYGPDDDYFKVKAEDKNTYILKYNRREDLWSLTFFRTESGNP